MDSDDRPLRILHLSDTHIATPGVLHYGAVDTRLALDRVLAHAAALEVDLVVASGDLSDDGSDDAYRHLRDTIGAWAERHRAPVVWAMGNHDLRAGFEAVLGDRETVIDVRARRVVVIDTSVPGAGYGELDDAALVRMRDRFDGAGEAGGVLVLHHPPIPAATALLAELELQDPGALGEACSTAGIRVILGGHYHLPMTGVLDRIPVVVAPGVANRSDVTAGPHRERSHAGSGYAVIDVPLDGPVRTVFVDVPGPETASAGDPLTGTLLFDLDDAQMAEVAREAGVATAG